MVNVTIQGAKHTALTWGKVQIRRIGRALFARTDADARRHGWQVTERCGGLARTYRDPRFTHRRRAGVHRAAAVGRSAVIGAPAPARSVTGWWR